MTNEKIYVGKAKYLRFRNGGEICKIWITPEGMESITRNLDNSGSINLAMSETRQPDRAGNTHTIYIDDYKPENGRGDNGNSRSRPEERRRGNSSRRDNGGFGVDPGDGPPSSEPEFDDDSIPF